MRHFLIGIRQSKISIEPNFLCTSKGAGVRSRNYFPSIQHGFGYLLFAIIYWTLIPRPASSQSIPLPSTGNIYSPENEITCTAFAISRSYLVTTSDCVPLRYDHEAKFENYFFISKSAPYLAAPLEVASTAPYKKKVYLKLSSERYKFKKPLTRSLSKYDQPIFISASLNGDTDNKRNSNSTGENENNKTVEIETKIEGAFLHEDLLYFKAAVHPVAGDPLLDEQGGYIGIYLGTAYYKGNTYHLSTYHNRDVDPMKIISFKPGTKSPK